MAKSRSAKKRQKARKVRPKPAGEGAGWQLSRVSQDIQKPSGGNGGGRDSAAEDQAQLEDVLPPSKSDFSIVGVGASAGGLEAFTQFLRAMPSDTGMALILVQHLSPKHESVLPELLSGATTMPVTQVTEEMEIKPNHVYVMPPNVAMGINYEGKFHLTPRPQDRTQHTPIDTFFRSLA